MLRSSWLLLACMALPIYAIDSELTQLRDVKIVSQCADVAPGIPYIRLTAIPQTTSLEAVWNAPANLACIDHYMVFVRPAGSSRQPKPHEVRSRSIIVSNLKPNTVYKVQVMAVNKRGKGPPSQGSVATLNGPKCNPRLRPGSPASAKGWPSPNRTDRVAITWMPPGSPLNACYTGYRAVANNAQTGATVLNMTVARTVKQLNINGLAAGTAYNIQISALSNVGDSAATAVAVTTKNMAHASPSTALQPTQTTTTARPHPGMARQQTLSAVPVFPQQHIGSSSSSFSQLAATPAPAGSPPRTSSNSNRGVRKPPSITSAAAGAETTLSPTPAQQGAALLGTVNPALSSSLMAASPAVQISPQTPTGVLVTPTASQSVPTQSVSLSSLQTMMQHAHNTFSSSPLLGTSSTEGSARDIGAAPDVLGAGQTAAGETASTTSSAIDNAMSTTFASNCRADVAPQDPLNFTASALSKSMIRLHWEHDAAGICVEGFQLDGYQLKTGDRVLDKQIGGTTYMLGKLAPGIEYAFTVTAVNSKGDSTPATAMVATPKG